MHPNAREVVGRNATCPPSLVGAEPISRFVSCIHSANIVSAVGETCVGPGAQRGGEVEWFHSYVWNAGKLALQRGGGH